VTAPDPATVAQTWGSVDRRQRNKLIAKTLLRSLITAVVLFVAYFVVPFDNVHDAGTVVFLTIGLVLVFATVAWQVHAIIGADYPRLQLIESLSALVPLLIVVFAATYILIEKNTPTAFNTPLSRTDSLYFTITVLSTVGFGDIVAKSGFARMIVSVQMVLDLVLIGIIVRVLMTAAQAGVDQGRGVRAQAASATSPPTTTDDGEPSG
jgi:hypothetical protein